MSNQREMVACICCAGEQDRPDFDYCRACGRGEDVAIPPARKLPESPLARAVRLARGLVEPEDVPVTIRATNAALTGDQP
jgi:hypothetical protein